MRYVLGFTAGGPTDTLSRVFCQKMSSLTGQQFVVENRVGAGVPARQFVKFYRSSARSWNLAPAAPSPACAAAATTPAAAATATHSAATAATATTAPSANNNDG